MPNLTSLYIDIHALRPGTVGAYTFAFLWAVIATMAAVAIDRSRRSVRYFLPGGHNHDVGQRVGCRRFLCGPQRRLGRVLLAAAALVFLH